MATQRCAQVYETEMACSMFFAGFLFKHVVLGAHNFIIEWMLEHFQRYQPNKREDGGNC